MNTPQEDHDSNANNEQHSAERAQYKINFLEWMETLTPSGEPTVTSADQSVDLTFGGCLVAADVGRYASDGLMTSPQDFFDSIQARVDQGTLTEMMCNHNGEHDAQQDTLVRGLISAMGLMALAKPTTSDHVASCTDPAYSVALIVAESLNEASTRTGSTTSSILKSIHDSLEDRQR